MTVRESARRALEARAALVELIRTDRLAAAHMLIGSPVVDPALAATIADTWRSGLASATVFLADGSMTELVDAAGPQMPDQPLRDVDVPTGAAPGLVWFEGGLPDRSGTPPSLAVQALGWQYLPGGHVLLRDGVGASILLTVYVNGRDLADVAEVPVGPGAPALHAISTVVWTLGTLIGTAFGEVPARDDVAPGFFQRAAAAFWALSASPTLTHSETSNPLHPTERRRHKRSGVLATSEPVHVVRVGSSSASVPVEDSGRRLQVRHIVRGHWRRQWHPSLGEHRHLWIAAHVKGPAEAPLLGGDRVFLSTGNRGTNAREQPRAPHDEICSRD